MKKKPFEHRSQLAQFHCAPKEFGEEVEYPFVKDELAEIRYIARQKTNTITEEKNNNITSPEGIYIKKMMENIFKIQLKSNKENDPIEKRKLEACKSRTKELLDTVLNSIKSYMRTILVLTSNKKFKDKNEIAQADDNRTKAHNMLMRDIKILNRSLIWWFGKFDPDELSDEHYEMYEKQEDIYITENINRLEIPTNGIYPPRINPKDRKQVTEWAKAIYKDLISIKQLSRIINLPTN
ncbi:hypothetical protein KKG71_01235 [Patescibacteria group bacterium]|nr:hypothetical protein [Patescibacteria group bacterium]